MNKSFIAVSVLLSLVLLFTLGSSHAVTLPSNIHYYAPVNVTNSQTSATGPNFQQMVNVTSSDTFWSYINTNGTTAFGQNVEFFYSNGTIIHSWLEQYHSTWALWWLKIGNIGASSTVTIYAGFTSKGTNLFNTNTTGEAPQLSATYGQYDNGVNVFNFYDNFAGTTLNTSKWNSYTSGGGTITVNNGITIVSPISGSHYLEEIATPTSITFNTPYLAEAYISSGSTLSNDYGEYGIFTGQTSDTTTNNALNENGYVQSPIYGSGLHYQGQPVNSGSNVAGSQLGTASATLSNTIMTAVWTATGNEALWYNYNSVQTFTNTGVSLPSAGGMGLMTQGQGSTLDVTAIFQWARIRAYPPNGVMPSVTFGAVYFYAPTLYLNGVSGNTTITYGTESNFTANVPTGYYVEIWANVSGTMAQIEPLTINHVTYTNTLHAGIYKVIAGTNVSGVSNVTYYETISKATPFTNLYLNGKKAGTANYTGYTLQQLTQILNVNSINNLTYKAYLVYPNSTVKNWMNFTRSTSGNYTVGSFAAPMLVNGNYKFYINTSGNQNYSSQTSSNVWAILSVPYPNLSLQYSSSFYGGSNGANASTAYNSSSVIILNITNRYFNKTYQVASNYGSIQYEIAGLNVGNYTITAKDDYNGLMTRQNFTVLAVEFYKCNANPSKPSGAVFNPIIYLKFYDENTLAISQNISTVVGSLTAEGQTSSGTQLGYTNQTAIQSGNLCIGMLSDPGATVTVNGNIFYTNNASNITRSYYFANTSLTQGIVHNITLYTLTTVTGIALFGFYTLSNQGAQVPALIQVYRYYPNTNDYRMIDYLQTASVGYADEWLMNGQYYVFNLYDLSGNLETITSQTLMTCGTTSGCTQPIVINPTQNLLGYSIANTYSSCTVGNSSGSETVTCSVSSGTTSGINYTLFTEQGGSAGNITICKSTLNTPDGVLSCTFNTPNFNTSAFYYYELDGNVGGNTGLLAANVYGNLGSNGGFGQWGLYIVLLALIIITLLAIYNPLVMLVMDLVMLIFLGYFGLYNLVVGTIISLIVVILLFAWQFKGGGG